MGYFNICTSGSKYVRGTAENLNRKYLFIPNVEFKLDKFAKNKKVTHT